MEIKILHCADIHIGSSGSSSHFAVRRKNEILQTFLRMISYAEKNEADLILIAGDLFDNHKPPREYLDEISSAFSKFCGKIFISPGNHDFYGENTFWKSWVLPENVTVFTEEAESIVLPEKGIKIHGGAFRGIYRSSHILNHFEADDKMINIAVIHGDIASDSSYGPVSAEEIRSSMMDYIALGHIHKQTIILKEGTTSYAYCGCLEGQGFDELSEKGFYFGTIEKGRADLEFVPFCRRRFIAEDVDISEADNKKDIPEIILRKIIEKYGEDGREWFYKIILKGESSIPFSDADIVAALESELYFVKIKNETKTPLKNLEEIASENSVRGIFARRMLERAKSGEDIENAVRIGLTAFSERVEFYEN